MLLFITYFWGWKMKISRKEGELRVARRSFRQFGGKWIFTRAHTSINREKVWYYYYVTICLKGKPEFEVWMEKQLSIGRQSLVWESGRVSAFFSPFFNVAAVAVAVANPIKCTQVKNALNLTQSAFDLYTWNLKKMGLVCVATRMDFFTMLPNWLIWGNELCCCFSWIKVTFPFKTFQ